MSLSVFNTLNKIKYILTDIDGVWTDGSMYYSDSGDEFKRFNTSDSAGVLFARLTSKHVAIITGERSTSVVRRAKKLKINNVRLGVSDKLGVAQELISCEDIHWEEVAFIGDDINDYQLLKKVGLSACPIQAPQYIQEIVDVVIPVKGGSGAFRAFVEYILKQEGLLDFALTAYLEQLSFDQ